MFNKKIDPIPYVTADEALSLQKGQIVVLYATSEDVERKLKRWDALRRLYSKLTIVAVDPLIPDNHEMMQLPLHPTYILIEDGNEREKVVGLDSTLSLERR